MFILPGRPALVWVLLGLRGSQGEAICRGCGRSLEAVGWCVPCRWDGDEWAVGGGWLSHVILLAHNSLELLAFQVANKVFYQDRVII